MRLVWCLMVVTYACLQRFGTHGLTCTVSQDEDQTLYNISHSLAVKASDCHYSWANASEYVLANQEEEIAGLVNRNCMDILITSKCFNNIILTLDCLSEEMELTANCTTDCSIKKRNENNIQKHELSTFLIVLVVILLVVLLGVLYWCRKKRGTANTPL